ncbi:MAG: M43 family zinc metalloprotease [Chitinophagales bacterium]|nr:M43 family zinc metalloprotease [Chitinophagales bacterium]
MRHALILLTVACGVLVGIRAEAQIQFCGSNGANKRMAELNPRVKMLQQYLDSLTTHGGNSRSNNDSTVYIIPIVFHVIHNYGPENISDEQIYDAVRILNEDFRKLNADTVDIVSEYKSIAADCRIEFRLANVDPDGNCTNGIDRIASLKTYVANDEAKLNPWPRSHYLNVWVVAQMPDGVAGYAYKPASADDFSNVDGVIILNDYIGSIGTGSPARSRALTHEIGHCLNLSHPWGDTNEPGLGCGDDGIFDTPLTRGFTSCPKNTARICNPPILENVQNYMEYSYCSNMFTWGQKSAMRIALESPIARRNDLWSPFSLNYAGVLRAPIACSPVADFTVDKNFVCLGTPVTLSNFSWRGPIGYEWEIEDGSTILSTDTNVTYTFTTPGWHEVSLKVLGQNGSDTLTKQKAVYVSTDYPLYTSMMNENFENENRFNDEWIPANMEMDSPEWEYTIGYGATGNACVGLKSFYNNGPDEDELITPPISLTEAGQKYLYFSYAGATKGNELDQLTDTLLIYYNINCSNSWVLLDKLSGTELYNNNFHWREFFPQAWHFSVRNILLPAATQQPLVRFKFKMKTNQYANNFYLDDINVSAVSSIENNIGNPVRFSVFPNPSNDQINIVYELEKPERLRLTIADALGKLVYIAFDGEATAGSHTINLDKATINLQSGIYNVSYQTNGKFASTRLIVL